MNIHNKKIIIKIINYLINEKNKEIIKAEKKYFGLKQKINCLNNHYFFIFKFNIFKYLIIVFFKFLFTFLFKLL